MASGYVTGLLSLRKVASCLDKDLNWEKSKIWHNCAVINLSLKKIQIDPGFLCNGMGLSVQLWGGRAKHSRHGGGLEAQKRVAEDSG